jgi:anaerobic selenocysteine-containing dehydrogenase
MPEAYDAPRRRARPGLRVAQEGKRVAAREGAMAEGGRRDGDRIADPWGRRTPYGAGQAWPVRVDEQVGDGRDGSGRGPVAVERWAPSACVLCSNGCGLDIGVAGGRIVGVRGRAGDRVNHGRLGPRGSSAGRPTRPPTG